MNPHIFHAPPGAHVADFLSGIYFIYWLLPVTVSFTWRFKMNSCTKQQAVILGGLIFKWRVTHLP